MSQRKQCIWTNISQFVQAHNLWTHAIYSHFWYRKPLSILRPSDNLVFMCWDGGYIIRHYHEVMMGAMASYITSLMIVYSTVHSGADQTKHQSSASLAFVREIHRWPVNSPHKGPVTQKMFPFDDVITTLCSMTRSMVTDDTHTGRLSSRRHWCRSATEGATVLVLWQSVWRMCLAVNTHSIKGFFSWVAQSVVISLSYMMTSSNGNIFRVTGHLCGEFTGLRWIPHTKVSDAELWCLLWSAPE